MSDHIFASRRSLAEALELLIGDRVVLENETVSTEQAVGRVSAAPVIALHDAPHYRASAMDGIAVRSADVGGADSGFPLTIKLIQSDTAPDISVEGVCLQIDTGGLLPDWADAVVRIEDTEKVDGGFVVRAPVAPGRDVRGAGEDIESGSRLLVRGHRIKPWDLGALLAAGVMQIEVARRPRLAIVATGSEVVEPTASPAAGKVVEFNGRMLAAAAGEWGADVIHMGIVGDDRPAISQALLKAVKDCDAVALIAGSSVGRRDFSADILADLGEIKVHGVDIMPGRPASITNVSGVPVVGIPGYPVSAIVVYEQLLKPLIERMQGLPVSVCAKTSAVVGRKIPSRLGVEEFRRVCLCQRQDGAVVSPLPSGAGSIGSVLRAHGWLRIGATCEGVDAGAEVEIELLKSPEQIAQSVVVTGSFNGHAAELEDQLRSCGDPGRMVNPANLVELVYIGLGRDDALEALVVGEAHGCIVGEEQAGPFLARAEGRVELNSYRLSDDELFVVPSRALTHPPLAAFVERLQRF